MNFRKDGNKFIAVFDYGELHVSGDEQYGFRPFQLMVSSIAGCSASVLNKVLIKQRLDVHDLEVSAEVTRNPEEANRIEKIALHYRIKGTGLSPEKVHKAIELARKNCPMVQSVKDSIEIAETFELL